ncbi:YihY/virulence factor BrkB family protein [Mariprofundus erugo]|nr:YihY/virulence factor BrkB family protein [Mariprofundus erugo]
MNELMMKVNAAFQHMLWPQEMESRPGWKLVLTRMLQVSFAIVRDFLEGQLTLRAMSLVYTTLLSLVPLLALTFSVLKGFGVQNQLEPLLVNTLSALGDKGEDVARQIVSFVDNIKVGVLGSLGLGMLIYTVISLLHKIEVSFNYIWHVAEARPIGQRFSEYLSVILVGPLLVFSALGMTASLMSSTVVQALSDTPLLGMIVHSIGKLIPYALVTIAFTFIYIFMPNTRVRIGPALIGGLVAGISWETAGWAFGAFVVNSGNYTAIYSGFAILIMFMIWLFVSWLILLLGTSIAFYCQHPEHLLLRPEQALLSAGMQEKLSLLAMTFIGRHYYQHCEWQMDALARWLGVPVNMAEKIVDKLHAAGFIMQTRDEPAPFVPSRDMETMHIAQLIEVLHQGSQSAAWPLPRVEHLEQLMLARDEAVKRVMGEMTLKQLIVAGMSDESGQRGAAGDEMSGGERLSGEKHI